MGKKSKTKGNGFENDIAKRIKEVFLPGIDAKTAHNLVHRTPMSGGHVERGDLIAKPPVLKYFPWFIECRNRENWSWKQVWEQGQESLILQWFIEDAEGKCHPYDQNSLSTHHRFPMLLFTQNFRRVYFAAWECDLETVLEYDEDGYSIEDILSPTPVMRIYVDTEFAKGYVVIGDFERLLNVHTAPISDEIGHEVAEYLGVAYETFGAG
jgi:hypothetical protein